MLRVLTIIKVIFFSMWLTCCDRKEERPNLSCMSLTDMALGRSCLLANTRITHLVSSSSSSWEWVHISTHTTQCTNSPCSWVHLWPHQFSLCHYCPPQISDPVERERERSLCIVCSTLHYSCIIESGLPVSKTHTKHGGNTIGTVALFYSYKID